MVELYWIQHAYMWLGLPPKQATPLHTLINAKVLYHVHVLLQHTVRKHFHNYSLYAIDGFLLNNLHTNWYSLLNIFNSLYFTMYCFDVCSVNLQKQKILKFCQGLNFSIKYPTCFFCTYQPYIAAYLRKSYML